MTGKGIINKRINSTPPTLGIEFWTSSWNHDVGDMFHIDIMDAPEDFPTQGIAKSIPNAIYLGHEDFEQQDINFVRFLRFTDGVKKFELGPGDNVKIKLLARISDAVG